MTLSILVVDDDETIRETLVEFFEASGHVARGAGTASDARRAATEHAPDVALVDLRLPDSDGLRLLEALRADDPDIGVILLTGHGDVRTAVRAMREGALDFLQKPVDLEELDAAVGRAADVVRMKRELSVLRARDRTGTTDATVPVHTTGPAGSANALNVGKTGNLDEIERMIDLAARNADAPLLLLGETGTGKGWLARRVHELSARAPHPFVEINCASLSATFLESELFGHERGAFTDAKQAKHGLLEIAGDGTVFLDEIGDMAPAVQPRLLTVLEEGRFRRLGGTRELRSSARVIAATNQPLDEAVAAGRFRADLFYRLRVLAITLPPLRERRSEIAALAEGLAPGAARLSPEALRALETYDWPGNIRELKNTLWRASIVSDGGTISAAHLALPSADGAPVPVAGTLKEAERRALAAALASTGGNRLHAARLLGIARSTLHVKMREYGLE